MSKMSFIALAIMLCTAGQLMADDAQAERRQSVELARCRLKLIDKVTLASDRPGILKFVEPKEGLSVEKEQQVAGLHDEVARAKLARAAKEVENDIEVRYAKKASDLAAVEFQQAEQANQRVAGAIPGIEINRLQLAAERSLLQIEQAEHTLEINRLVQAEAAAELKTLAIHAPFAGIVTQVFKHKGEAVRQGDPIIEIASTNRLRAEGYVDLVHVWNIRVGDPVVLSLDVPDVELKIEEETFEGKIVFVDLEVEPVSRRVKVWADVPNRDGLLRAGLTATMRVLPARTVEAESPVDPK